jgi:lycopene cyclase domain-containing protein
MFGQYSHLFYSIVIPLIANIIMFSTFELLGSDFLRANLDIILGVSFLFAVPGTLIADTFAVKTGAWTFGQDMIVGLRILEVPFEDYVYGFTVSFSIATATIGCVKILDHYDRDGLEL